MTSPHLRPLLVPALLLAGLAAPCNAQTTHVVDSTAISFVPQDLTIQVGDSVMWINLAQGNHNVAECDCPATENSTYNGGVFSGIAGQVGTFTQTFTAPGTFCYVCEPHVQVGMFGTLTIVGADPGTASCFGVGCPCGNDDPAAGCANSTGAGGLLGGSGSTSVASDDLVLSATQLPPGNQGLFYMGDTEVQNPFFDGFQCALGTTFRFLGSVQNTGAGGTMTLGPGIAGDAGGLVTAGTTWRFHAWHRDVPGSPCGTGANLTHLYSVTFAP